MKKNALFPMIVIVVTLIAFVHFKLLQSSVEANRFFLLFSLSKHSCVPFERDVLVATNSFP